MSVSLTATVAAEVRAEMARQRRSQRQVADALGVSGTYVWRRLTGQVPFDLAELEAVAAYLGRPVAHFMRTEQAGAA